MAIEKDNYGFRVGSWNSKIILQGQDVFESSSNSTLAALVGCTEGSCSNYRKEVAAATGWSLPASNRQSNGDTAERKPRQSNGSKRKGCFPARLEQSLNKALGRPIDSDDPEFITNPTWAHFVCARESQGPDWVSFISKKVKEKELTEFNLWVESNDAADKAESATSAAQQKALDAAVKLIEAAGGTVTW